MRFLVLAVLLGTCACGVKAPPRPPGATDEQPRRTRTSAPAPEMAPAPGGRLPPAEPTPNDEDCPDCPPEET